MRRKIDLKKLNLFMQHLASEAKGPGTVYFTGGSTMLLLGIRNQTIDIDLKLDPEPKGVFQAIATLKEQLDISVELAAPSDFIPTPADWRDRCIHINTIGVIEFYHFDLCSQALSKLERGHEQDLFDVVELLKRSFISPQQIRETFALIRKSIIRYPALDAAAFEHKVNRFLKEFDTID